MSTPVVVQGTAIEGSFGSNPQPVGGGDNEAAKTGCKDPIFALLFYANVIAIVALAVMYGPDAMAGAGETGVDYTGYIIIVVILGVASLVASFVGLLILMKFPESIIKIALIFEVAMSLAFAILCFVTLNYLGGIMGLVFFAIGVCYARIVWPRIPFATANLVTAITGIKANFGVVTFAFLFSILGFAWVFGWSVAFVGVFDSSEVNYGLLFLMFLALFFGQQVLQNSVHVTVAGVVGTWWVAPNESGFCGSAVWNSFIRTMTTSFGSICFGSLLVAILQALKALANAARANDDGGIGACIAECILGCLAAILEYFNKWAFIYVGVYGYGYMDAGKNVFTLFRDRGWEAVIADDLVDNALFLVSLVVGLIMGGFGALIEVTGDLIEEGDGNEKVIAFILGFVVGFAICSILMSTIGSGVNTVVVMFADAPAEFQRNHPQLSERMRTVWAQIYPGSI